MNEFKQKRIEAGLSINMLSKLTGLSRKTITSIELGNKAYDYTISKLNAVLSQTIEEPVEIIEQSKDVIDYANNITNMELRFISSTFKNGYKRLALYGKVYNKCSKCKAKTAIILSIYHDALDNENCIYIFYCLNCGTISYVHKNHDKINIEKQLFEKK